MFIFQFFFFFFQSSRCCVSLCLPTPVLAAHFIYILAMDTCGYMYTAGRVYMAVPPVVSSTGWHSVLFFHRKTPLIHYSALFRNRWSEGSILNTMHAVIQSVNLREVESYCFLKTISSHPTSWVHGSVFLTISLLVCKQNWRGKHDTGVLHCFSHFRREAAVKFLRTFINMEVIFSCHFLPYNIDG